MVKIFTGFEFKACITPEPHTGDVFFHVDKRVFMVYHRGDWLEITNVISENEKEDLKYPKTCCDKPDPYKNIISNNLKFWSCKNCGADLGDI